jgi:dTDP-4-amino-4,6-dideoxygalactose transaminase
MQEPFLTFGKPDIGLEEIDEVVDSMRKGWLGTGPKVARFEREFAEYKGFDPSCVVALNSCTAALHLSLLAAGIGPGDEVISPALTFCAAVNAILYTGATPVLADVEPDTQNLDLADAERRITPRTRAILPVHFAGRPCDLDALRSLSVRHSLVLIEDCAHALEASWRGHATGSLADYACFSFYATKNITTGEGGMVMARDPAQAERLKRLSLHGLSADAWERFGDGGWRHYQVVDCGYKYNMMDLQAAVGIHQLARVQSSWQKRESLWQAYQQLLQPLPVVLPLAPAPETRHAYHLYTVRVEDAALPRRDEILSAMTASGIGVGVHYLCLADHPYYQQRLGWRPEDYPVAARIGRSTLSLPLMPQLTPSQQSAVVTALRNALRA